MTGSELVRGERTDLNGPFLARELLSLGLAPARISIVGDTPGELAAALGEGLQADLCVVSGGLGPTHDDRTVELLAAAAGLDLVVDEELEREIEARSRAVADRLGRPYADFATGVSKQATRPESAISVGLVGTAPGLVVPLEGRVAVVLPGPPWELQQLWPRVLETEPVQALLRRARRPSRRVLRFYGASESAVAQALAAAGGDGDGVEATICARDFEIHIDLVVDPGAEARAESLSRALLEPLGRYLFSEDERPVEEMVLELCRQQGLTLATAESCTGGLVAARLTSIPGASDVFLGAIVAYANEVKEAELGVPADGAARARRRIGGDGGGDGRRGQVTARRRRRRRRHRRRGAREEARPRSRSASSTSMPRRPTAATASSSTSRPTASRSAAGPPSPRCISCADFLSQSRDSHV